MNGIISASWLICLHHLLNKVMILINKNLKSAFHFSFVTFEECLADDNLTLGFIFSSRDINQNEPNKHNLHFGRNFICVQFRTN
jgi:hypothetical protein